LNPGAAIAASLAHPAVVLVKLSVFRVELLSVKIMAVADTTVSSQVKGAKIPFGLPIALLSGIFHSKALSFLFFPWPGVPLVWVELPQDPELLFCRGFCILNLIRNQEIETGPVFDLLNGRPRM
jgi:hypothetical protein